MKNITEAQRQQVNSAVAAAESRSAAEIVPVIVETSGRYDRSEDLWGLCCGAAAMLLTYEFQVLSGSPPGLWREHSLWPAFSLALALAIGFLAGVIIANLLPGIRKVFISRLELREEAFARAKQIFFDQRVHHTSMQTGVLIYITLFERQAVVLVDEAILSSCGQPAIDQWCQRLTGRLKSQNVVEALTASIEEIGQSLAEQFPSKGENRDELPDALILPHLLTSPSKSKSTSDLPSEKQEH